MAIRGRSEQGDRRLVPDRSWRQRVLSAVPFLFGLWVLAVGCKYLSSDSIAQGAVLVGSGICLAGAWLLWRRVAPALPRDAQRRRLPSLLSGDKNLFTYDEPTLRSAPREFAEFTVLATAIGVGVGLLGVNVILFGSADNFKYLGGWVLTLGSVGWLALTAWGVVRHILTRPKRVSN